MDTDIDEDKEAFVTAALAAAAADLSALILVKRGTDLRLIPHNVSRDEAIKLLHATLLALDTSECVGGVQ